MPQRMTEAGVSYGDGGANKKNKGAQALFNKLKSQGYKMVGGAHSPNAEEIAKLKVAAMGTERRDMPMSDNMSQAMTMARRGLGSYGGGGSSYGRIKK
tara:strand:+ start:5133 stop:5426 length:294 start_codon:yes stop_codon:yes gene_type:complete